MDVAEQQVFLKRSADLLRLAMQFQLVEREAVLTKHNALEGKAVLSARHVEILLALREGQLARPEIALALDFEYTVTGRVNPSTLTKTLNDLWQGKEYPCWVERLSNPKDGRVPLYRLTRAGKTLTEDLATADAAALQPILDMVRLLAPYTPMADLPGVVMDRFRKLRGPGGVASIAGVYDCLIKGCHHLPTDCALVRDFERTMPIAGQAARANRAFLRRALRYLVEEKGISFFVDIGCGLPLPTGNVHDVVRQAEDVATVVCVDREDVIGFWQPIQQTKEANITTTVGDIREVDGLLRTDAIQRTIGRGEAVGVILSALLHFVPDSDHPEEIVQTLCRTLPKGSCIVVSHAEGHDHGQGDGELAAILKKYELLVSHVIPRPREALASWFAIDGMKPLVEKGLVHVPIWGSDLPDEWSKDSSLASKPETSRLLGGVFEKVAEA